jgi:hypothetical protein
MNIVASKTVKGKTMSDLECNMMLKYGKLRLTSLSINSPHVMEHFRINKSEPMVPILCWMIQVHTPPFYSFQINFNNIFPSAITSFKWFPLSYCSITFLFSSVPCVLHALIFSSSLFAPP